MAKNQFNYVANGAWLRVGAAASCQSELVLYPWGFNTTGLAHER